VTNYGYDPLGPERSKVPRLALVIAGIVAGISILGGTLYWVAHGQADADLAPVLDKQGCMVDVAPPKTLFVLADQSDPIPEVEMANLQNQVMRESQKLPTHSRVVVFVVNAKAYEKPFEVFSRCTPDELTSEREEQRVWEKVVGGDSAGAKRQTWEAEFGEPLKGALDHLKDVPSSDTALITAFNQLGRLAEFKLAQNKEILVYSDMLENSELIHLNTNPYPSLTELQNKFGALSVDADLKQAAIRIAYIPRPHYYGLQTRGQQEWWRNYFVVSGAASVTFDPEIPG
jgi:hypothetical protein